MSRDTVRAPSSLHALLIDAPRPARPQNLADTLSPLDDRYWDAEISKYLSHRTFHRAKLIVEIALVNVLADRGLCPHEAADEIFEACKHVTPEEVDIEERTKTKHDIRALVNCIQRRVSDHAKQYVHLSATSYDIVDTANVLRYKLGMEKLLLPRLQGLHDALMTLAERTASTPQIGRTHGQHAVPITFGFAIASYVNRLGDCIESLQDRTDDLVAKFSGAVGAYNASSLLVEDPFKFEQDILEKLDLQPAIHSTQIVPAEPLTRLLLEIQVTAGVLANLSRDMRNLQRTEISEVGEVFELEQVGSSTMPHKRNPITFENVESLWTLLLGRMATVFTNQISDHQRDLTNSASSRAAVEIVAYLAVMAGRLTPTMSLLVVDEERMRKNLEMSLGSVVAEPLYILLAREGHPDAHEAVRRLTFLAKKDGRSVVEHANDQPDLRPYIAKLSTKELALLSSPETYQGLAREKTLGIVEFWREWAAKERELAQETSEPSGPAVPQSDPGTNM